ncbi:hypothetical protein B0T10DRAFT_571815 [Thelonectria olida]|uniref:Uncharacterized protein n=1 Tax=Thelonectria olida TaxID=1576542 RepID=A0A9P8W6W9_9HYPO|nr:hypothetical protein B0T10DRAFT_571815 [Thelonectria olida]
MAPKFINKLHDKRVLVVGGSTGIGFAVAQGAVEHGAHVILSSSNQTKLDTAITRLKDHLESNGLAPRDIAGKTCDLSNPDTIEDNVKSLLEFATQGGNIDHVVFTAGDPVRTVAIDKVVLPDIAKASTVRITGAIMLAKHLPKYMTPGTNSSLTLTGGTMSWRPGPGWSVLAGTAAGAEPLSRALAIDLKPLRVNCAVPGAIHTELFDNIPKEILPGVLETMKKDTITGTVGTAEQMAEVYLYLMKSTFATGSTVVADGGRMVGDSKGADITI